jgi:diguanylate cyclase (GGDEF)-like protein
LLAAARPDDEDRRLASLYALGLVDTDPEEDFDRVTRLAQRLFDTPMALVTLVDDQRQWFKSKIGIDDAETSRVESFCAHAVADDKPLVVPDARDDERFHDNPFVVDAPEVRFYAGVPVHSPDGATLGTLCVIDSAPRDLAEGELAPLSDLARLLEQTISARYEANVDPLTGLWNRRGLDAAARHLLALADRDRRAACLVFADLDGLKPINDELGHEAGDDAIRAAAEALRATFRASDVCARVGGDELAVLSLGTADELRQALERLGDELRARNRSGDLPFHLSLSCGSVERPPEGPDLDGLLAEADARMYEHKRARRALRA